MLISSVIPATAGTLWDISIASPVGNASTKICLDKPSKKTYLKLFTRLVTEEPITCNYASYTPTKTGADVGIECSGSVDALIEGTVDMNSLLVGTFDAIVGVEGYKEVSVIGSFKGVSLGYCK